MRDETEAFLDGERGRAELSPAAREEAEAWERLLVVMREDMPGPAPAWLEGAVMAEVGRVSPSVLSRLAGWLFRPSLSLSPLGAGLVAAALVVVLVAPWRRELEPAPAATASSNEPTVVYVQFVLEAPSARSVVVAGDFNEWDGRHVLEDPDGDGVWNGRVPLQPGVHEYMFVVDGTNWVTDPTAGRWSDDGFGNRNAVVAVAPPGAA